jgi:hypothetical protein
LLAEARLPPRSRRGGWLEEYQDEQDGQRQGLNIVLSASGILSILSILSILNREYAMETDLTKPVLVATLEAGGEPTALFIDGVHRLYRAWREGVASLPAYVLTVAETQQIKRDRIIGAGITPRRNR